MSVIVEFINVPVLSGKLKMNKINALHTESRCNYMQAPPTPRPQSINYAMFARCFYSHTVHSKLVFLPVVLSRKSFFSVINLYSISYQNNWVVLMKPLLLYYRMFWPQEAAGLSTSCLWVKQAEFIMVGWVPNGGTTYRSPRILLVKK